MKNLFSSDGTLDIGDTPANAEEFYGNPALESLNAVSDRVTVQATGVVTYDRLRSLDLKTSQAHGIDLYINASSNVDACDEKIIPIVMKNRQTRVFKDGPNVYRINISLYDVNEYWAVGMFSDVGVGVFLNSLKETDTLYVTVRDGYLQGWIRPYLGLLVALKSCPAKTIFIVDHSIDVAEVFTMLACDTYEYRIGVGSFHWIRDEADLPYDRVSYEFLDSLLESPIGLQILSDDDRAKLRDNGYVRITFQPVT